MKRPRSVKEYKQDPRVEDVYKSDHSGDWKWYVDLKSGYWNVESGTNTIRGDTVKMIIDYWEFIEKDPRSLESTLLIP